MKKLLAILLSMLLLCAAVPLGAVSVAAEVLSGTTGDCAWTLVDGHLTISGEGKMADYESKSIDGSVYSATHPWGRNIRSVTIEHGVTAIGAHAFAGCTKLLSIVLPDSITTIEKCAFLGCSRLTDVDLGTGVVTIGSSAFYHCTKLCTVTIPDKVTHIPGSAFEYCSSLKSVILPSGLISIGSYAFQNCTNLTEITLPDDVSTIEESAFAYCKLSSIVIPDSVTTIGNNAFAYNRLSDVSVGDGIASVANTGLLNSSLLTSIILGNGFVEISPSLFEDFNNLTTVVLGDSITTIGETAFFHCDNLTTIALPANLITVQMGAFAGCPNLTDIYYNGTDDEWAAIDIATSNNSLLTATRHKGSCIHSYDHLYDPECNRCGEVREVEDIPQDSPIFSVDNVQAGVGNLFTVAVRTLHNPGIVSFKLNVHYDTNLLELISAEERAFGGMTYSPLTRHPFILNWVDAVNPDRTDNEELVQFTFRVKDGVEPTQTTISLSYAAVDVYNAAMENVFFLTQSGTVNITSVLYGDVDGDGNINNRDIGTLQRYLNDWDVAVNPIAADVNGDTKINNHDLALLQQYLNGWDVEWK